MGNEVVEVDAVDLRAYLPERGELDFTDCEIECMRIALISNGIRWRAYITSEPKVERVRFGSTRQVSWI